MVFIASCKSTITNVFVKSIPYMKRQNNNDHGKNTTIKVPMIPISQKPSINPVSFSWSSTTRPSISAATPKASQTHRPTLPRAEI